ncbi:hypothetical protein KM176_09875 [Pseudooceanicola sp. CBS1P-1]|uniref:Acyloxyacyl hydrolase n=1 Tax=Pseudooceanicola albus TaxID=2692189 RepID=A0A6L7G5W4_9RHOB|nr:MULTISPECIES: hypothetical protein [Pseudooceanicola]MBT9384167.1 hypothetical protein [Pseudooceanicola endophyticus]MXN19734.1 hypothetical protein [Pseudooceanicola albus]
MPSVLRFLRRTLWIGALALLPVAAQAGETPWRVGIFEGQWAATRLPLLPYNLVTGGLSFRDSYLTSVIVSRQVGEADLRVPGTALGLAGVRFELEGTLSRHSGLQDHDEATLGVMTRSRDYTGRAGAISLGWANGLSWAFSPPDYEYGVDGVRGEKTRQLQYYMGFEAEYTPVGAQHFSLFARLHHRSGIYGVISPSKTGSNILGVGLRWKG